MKLTHLTWLESIVKRPYRKTKSPTRAAGISMPVYHPSHAKYRPIFSPKYRLQKEKARSQNIVCDDGRIYKEGEGSG